jgi:hypothetical protein
LSNGISAPPHLLGPAVPLFGVKKDLEMVMFKKQERQKFAAFGR